MAKKQVTPIKPVLPKRVSGYSHEECKEQLKEIDQSILNVSNGDKSILDPVGSTKAQQLFDLSIKKSLFTKAINFYEQDEE